MEHDTVQSLTVQSEARAHKLIKIPHLNTFHLVFHSIFINLRFFSNQMESCCFELMCSSKRCEQQELLEGEGDDGAEGGRAAN